MTMLPKFLQFFAQIFLIANFKGGIFMNSSFYFSISGFAILWESQNCDECVVAGQNVFQGPTIHFPRLECCVESHHLHSIHLV